MVMEGGSVKQYDSPANLMHVPSGAFRAMVVEAGFSDDFALQQFSDQEWTPCLGVRTCRLCSDHAL